jgi:hypothetical protein
MSDAQQQSIAQLHGMLQTFSAASMMRTAASVGVIKQLMTGQKSLMELCQACQIDERFTLLLLNGLQAVGVIERYEEDYALSQAARLLGKSNSDFGAGVFDSLESRLTDPANRSPIDNSQFRLRLASRQWVHTSAAMQAAEVLEVGRQRTDLKLLELGSGAGVWGAAMAYQDPGTQVVSVDNTDCMAMTVETYKSIELTARHTAIVDDYRTYDVELGQYDMVILPDLVEIENDADAVTLLGRSADAVPVGGEVVLIEQLTDEGGPPISITQRNLELALATQAGKLRHSAEIQQLLYGAGFGDAKWGWLTESGIGLALIVATKV